MVRQPVWTEDVKGLTSHILGDIAAWQMVEDCETINLPTTHLGRQSWSELWVVVQGQGGRWLVAEVIKQLADAILLQDAPRLFIDHFPCSDLHTRVPVRQAAQAFFHADEGLHAPTRVALQRGHCGYEMQAAAGSSYSTGAEASKRAHRISTYVVAVWQARVHAVG